MDARDLFMRQDVMDQPRLVFQLWYAWQTSPVGLPDMRRAEIAAQKLEPFISRWQMRFSIDRSHGG